MNGFCRHCGAPLFSRVLPLYIRPSKGQSLGLNWRNFELKTFAEVRERSFLSAWSLKGKRTHDLAPRLPSTDSSCPGVPCSAADLFWKHKSSILSCTDLFWSHSYGDVAETMGHCRPGVHASGGCSCGENGECRSFCSHSRHSLSHQLTPAWTSALIPLAPQAFCTTSSHFGHNTACVHYACFLPTKLARTATCTIFVMYATMCPSLLRTQLSHMVHSRLHMLSVLLHEMSKKFSFLSPSTHII